MKKEIKINFRVEVFPRTTLYGITVAEEEDVCISIVADINRHVNDVRFTEIVSDTDGVCEHCGSPWTEDDDEYNGGCCAKDEEANFAEQEDGA